MFRYKVRPLEHNCSEVQPRSICLAALEPSADLQAGRDASLVEIEGKVLGARIPWTAFIKLCVQASSLMIKPESLSVEPRNPYWLVTPTYTSQVWKAKNFQLPSNMGLEQRFFFLTAAKFTWHKTNHFKVSDTAAFTTSTVLCNYRIYPAHFRHLKRKACTHQASIPPSPWQWLVCYFYPRHVLCLERASAHIYQVIWKISQSAQSSEWNESLPHLISHETLCTQAAICLIYWGFFVGLSFHIHIGNSLTEESDLHQK